MTECVDVLPRTIFRRSADRGITEDMTGEDTVYCGIVTRMSHDDFFDKSKVGELEDQALRQLREEFALGTIGRWRVVVDGILERYDVLNLETGDMMVMYRVPVQVAERQSDD